jgi:CheY-like chemotaxis protein
MTRMLVIDDDAAWRALYRLTFEGHFEILEAADGQEGLAALDAFDPDVIVLDLRMPRMDGLDFIRRLGRKRVRATIVVCSGALDDAEGPRIPGVQLAPKSPDLRDLWSALRSAAPELTGAPVATRHVAPSTEDGFWRD